MRTAFIVLLLFLFAGPGRAQDEIQAVGAVWNDFVSSLRRGDYPNAHALFSPESRAVMPYGEFVAEYGPLSAAREMVLTKPESQGTSVDDDWAELTYGGTNPATGRKFKIGVAFVRNEGGWGLVAARNETAEKVEAGARGLLRMVWNARGQGGVRELIAALNEAHAKNPLMRFYRIETDGQAVRAFPLRPGLRTFYLDNLGMVRSMERPEAAPRHPATGGGIRVPERSAMAPKEPGPPQKPERPLGPDGMPELPEPPPRGAAGGTKDLDEEIAEPPMPPSRAGSRAVERPSVSLPDTIR